MKIRPAYPDELARAKTLLSGHPVPPEARFLVGVKAEPVERLVASIPWWKIPLPKSDAHALRFHFQCKGTPDEESLREILEELEALANENQLTTLLTDFSLPEAHPLYLLLTSVEYEISQTDRYFSMPGEAVNQRCLRVYQRVRSRMPDSWKVESIREHRAEDVFPLVAESRLMSPQQFQAYWDFANRERFEEKYSCVVAKDGKIMSAFLVTQPRADELHIHVDVVRPEFFEFSGLLTVAMRHFGVSNAPEGFPRIYTSRADSKKHVEGGNTPLRYGGEEHEPRHFLRKSVSLA